MFPNEHDPAQSRRFAGGVDIAVRQTIPLMRFALLLGTILTFASGPALRPDRSH